MLFFSFRVKGIHGRNLNVYTRCVSFGLSLHFNVVKTEGTKIPEPKELLVDADEVLSLLRTQAGH